MHSKFQTLLSNRKASTLVLAFFVAIASVASQAEVWSHDVYITVADAQEIPLSEPRDKFDCGDKIYTVVTLNNYSLGRHELSVLWIDPAGTTRENTQYPFHVVEESAKLWAWLSLSRARGAGMLQWLNPAAGLEEFIGPWNIEVRIDGKKIASREFEVIC